MSEIVAKLALEDGTVYTGRGFGATGETFGEVVFNTSMTGYQEILTDPSYRGQIVTMTYPLIGNYGVNEEDIESREIFVEGFIVKELSRVVSNWRSSKSLDSYLRDARVPGISDLDTRSLVRHIRERGSMRGCLSTLEESESTVVERARSAPEMVGSDLASVVTCKNQYDWSDAQPRIYGSPALLHPRKQTSEERRRFHVVAYDFGLKYN